MSPPLGSYFIRGQDHQFVGIEEPSQPDICVPVINGAPPTMWSLSERGLCVENLCSTSKDGSVFACPGPGEEWVFKPTAWGPGWYFITSKEESNLTWTAPEPGHKAQITLKELKGLPTQAFKFSAAQN